MHKQARRCKSVRGLLSVVLVISCATIPAERTRAELLEVPAAVGKPVIDEPAPPPATDGDRAKPDEELAAITPEAQAVNTATAEVSDAIELDVLGTRIGGGGKRTAAQFLRPSYLGREPVSAAHPRADDTQR